jgi:hypothetical protein
MTDCLGCGAALSVDRPGLRSEAGPFHLPCAPSDLIEHASEEYRAIVRKGVSYFVQKYADAPTSLPDPGAEFLRLGNALEQERARRT